MANVDPDPVNQMNLWTSAGTNHPWNPAQKTPATAWEAEIDKLMLTVAASPEIKKRKAAFDRVQEIVWEQAPMLYLVTPHALAAVSPVVRNAAPVALRPRVFWNAEHLSLDNRTARAR